MMKRTFRENKDGTTTVIEREGGNEVEILVDKNWKVLHIYRRTLPSQSNK